MEPTTGKQHAHELIDRLDPSMMTTAVRFLEFIAMDVARQRRRQATPQARRLQGFFRPDGHVRRILVVKHLREAYR